MSSTGFYLALSCGLAVCCPALAQNQRSNSLSQKPAVIQQLKSAGMGAQPLGRIYDGTKPNPNPAQAHPAPKPSAVGQPVNSTKTALAYKPALAYNPAQPSMHSVNTATVPLPASAARYPASQPTVTVGGLIRSRAASSL
jgi:hypothetical protein